MDQAMIESGQAPEMFSRPMPPLLDDQTGQSCKGTILLVEDEPAVREVTCEGLQMAGDTVLKAGSAREAAQLFGEHADSADVLLTDGDEARVLYLSRPFSVPLLMKTVEGVLTRPSVGSLGGAFWYSRAIEPVR